MDVMVRDRDDTVDSVSGPMADVCDGDVQRKCILMLVVEFLYVNVVQ